MTQAIRAIGIQFQLGDGGAPETFSTVAEVLDITGPNLTAELIDVTNQQSPANFNEFIDGAKDAGEFSFNINYNPADPTHDGTTGLISKWKNGGTHNFKVVWPDAGSTTWEFAGVITGFQVTGRVREQLQASVTIRITGEPTLV